MSAPAERADAATPRCTWVLAGDKPGDNGQSLSLAAAVGWPFEVKQLRYLATRTSEERFPLDRAASSPLAPPWPDLVIGCGRRSVGVAREIRRHGGPTTKLVQLGRPRADLDYFDLVVTTPQYRLPDHANVLHLMLPLHRIDREAWARAAAEWEGKLAALPRPLTAVLVGGSAKPFVLDVPSARRLGEQASALVRAEGGALLVSTSRRTPEDAARVLVESLTVPAYVHHWSPDGGPNPYAAYLALADAFIVTADSASMLTEACGTGKRVWIADLPKRRTLRAHTKILFRRFMLAVAPDLPKRGRIRYPRDLERLHRALTAANRALPLGKPFTTPPPPPLDETERAAARVRGLFGE
ncbi:MAG: ELM1/GtrOC1 family putative glycosyltransferase [Candidatus Binatia bacterium]